MLTEYWHYFIALIDDIHWSMKKEQYLESMVTSNFCTPLHRHWRKKSFSCLGNDVTPWQHLQWKRRSFSFASSSGTTRQTRHDRWIIFGVNFTSGRKTAQHFHNHTKTGTGNSSRGRFVPSSGRVEIKKPVNVNWITVILYQPVKCSFSRIKYSL